MVVMENEKLGDMNVLDEETVIDAGFCSKGVLHKEKETSFETKPFANNGNINISADNSLQQEHSSTGIIGDEEKEEIMQELRDCLPRWVTREQKLDLISSLGSNIVEIVDIFYERETEFYQQVSASTSSASQTSFADDETAISKLDVVKSTRENIDIHTSQVYQFRSIIISPRNVVSPVKRKKNISSRSSKKSKRKSKLESTCPKQSTITKFFDKALSK